jgi:hypothetical protein
MPLMPMSRAASTMLPVDFLDARCATPVEKRRIRLDIVDEGEHVTCAEWHARMSSYRGHVFCGAF